jgi:hypothetical protein
METRITIKFEGSMSQEAAVNLIKNLLKQKKEFGKGEKVVVTKKSSK